MDDSERGVPFPPARLTCFGPLEDWAAEMEVFLEERVDEIAALLASHDEPAALADALDEVFSRYVADDDTLVLTAALDDRGDVEVEQAETDVRRVLGRRDGVWRLLPDKRVGADGVGADGAAMDAEALAAALIEPIWWGDRGKIATMVEELEEALIG